MPYIKLDVKDAGIDAEITGDLTAGMVGVPVEISFDEAWEGLHKTLVCRTGDVVRTVLIQNDHAVVAHEVMIANGKLELGVEGRNDDGTVVIPTFWKDCGKIMEGTDAQADPSTDPTLPVWSQLQSRLENLEAQKSTLPTAEEIGAIPAPDAAEVGQYFRISAVDEAGNVTAVEAVEAPTGGGGEVWETIIDYTVPEDCVSVTLKTDINGNTFSLKKAIATIVLYPLADFTTSAISFTTDSSRADNPYSANTFRHGLCQAPTEANKYSYIRAELIKTPTGV